jgi:peptide/nickel transport system substrate-binding protein
MSHHRRYRLSALLGVAVLALTACGGSGDDADAPGNGDDGNDSTTEPEQEAVSGGDLAVATQRPITTLDPHGDMGADLGTALAGRAIFDRLVSVDGDGIVPELAEESTVSEDATEWVFTLREGVTFSDGTPLTSDDVVGSIERIQDLEGPPAGNIGGVEVEARDESTVVFTSEAGDPALAGKLSLLWITPGDRAGEDGFFAVPVGSGPFQVESFTPEETLVLVPNPNHWGGGPNLDRLELRFIPETAARMTALRTGEVQLTWGVPDDQVPSLRSEDSLVIESVPSNATFTMWFNSSRDGLADAEVRRALWQAVNFEEIITALYPETGALADSIVAPPVFGYSPQEPVTYDPDSARAALEDAGFDFDTTFELQLRGEEFRQFAQAVTSDLRAIGVQVEPVEKEPGVWIEDLLALEWDINLQSVSVPSLDAATNVGRLYPCAAERTGYCNDDLDAVLAEADSVADAGRREQLYAEAAEIIWADAVGMFPMFPQIVYAWQDRVDGVDLDPSSVPGFAGLTYGAGS